MLQIWGLASTRKVSVAHTRCGRSGKHQNLCKECIVQNDNATVSHKRYHLACSVYLALSDFLNHTCIHMQTVHKHTRMHTSTSHCCLCRTGPAALTQAMYNFFKQAGVGMMDFNESNITSSAGLRVKDVRVLPLEHLGGGWEVVGQKNGTCEDFGKRHANALVCHMFWGSWKSKWTLRPSHTYGSCAPTNRTELVSSSQG